MPYQLQLPDGVTPERLCDDVTNAAIHGGMAAVLPPAIVQRVAIAVRQVLEARLYAHDTCDLHRSCLDAARPTAWNNSPQSAVGLEVRKRLRLIHLRAEDGLEGFAGEVADRVLAALQGSGTVSPSVPPSRAGILQAIRATLGPYLYEGDLCEIDQMMRAADRARVFRGD